MHLTLYAWVLIAMVTIDLSNLPNFNERHFNQNLHK